MVKWQSEINWRNGAKDDSSFDSLFSAGGETAEGAAVLQPVCSMFPHGSESQPWINTLRPITQQAGRHVVIFTSLCCVDIVGKLTKSCLLKKLQKKHRRVGKGKRNKNYPLYALISDDWGFYAQIKTSLELKGLGKSRT